MATKGIWVPIEILRDHSLTMQEKLVLLEIGQLMELDNKQCYASNEHFAKLLNVSRKSVSNTISNLVKKGEISVELSDRNHKRLLSIKSGQPSIKSGQPSIKSGESKDNKTNNRTVIGNPTLTEILDIGKKLNYDSKSCTKFYNYYESMEWKRGRTKIKDFVPLLRNWNMNEKPKPSKQKFTDASTLVLI